MEAIPLYSISSKYGTQRTDRTKHAEFNFCFYLFFSSLGYKMVKNNDFLCRIASAERFHFPSYQPPTTVVPCSYLSSRYRHEQNTNKTWIKTNKTQTKQGLPHAYPSPGAIGITKSFQAIFPETIRQLLCHIFLFITFYSYICCCAWKAKRGYSIKY